MQKFLTKCPWMVIIAGMLILIVGGVLYIWTVFGHFIEEAAGWNHTMAVSILSAGVVSFAVSGSLAQRYLSKLSPRLLVFLGGLIIGTGYILAGLINPLSYITVLLCIGVLGGTGIGFSYFPPIALSKAWYKDKIGIAAGWVAGGFGLASVLWGSLAGGFKIDDILSGVTEIPPSGMLIDHGISTTFIAFGIAFIVIISISSLFMVEPPKNWKSDVEAAAPSRLPANFPVSELFKTMQAKIIFFAFLISAGSGLTVIALMSIAPFHALMAAGVAHDPAHIATGIAISITFALGNFIGRPVWGKVCDWINPKRALITMQFMQGVCLIIFPFVMMDVTMLFILSALLGFAFGGNFSIMPTITAVFIGSIAMYSHIFLAYGLGGGIMPIAGGYLGDLGNFPLIYIIAGGLNIFAGFTSMFLKKFEPDLELLKKFEPDLELNLTEQTV